MLQAIAICLDAVKGWIMLPDCVWWLSCETIALQINQDVKMRGTVDTLMS